MNRLLKRYQEFSGWMPILLVLAVVAWVVLGGVSDRDDLIRWLLELPVKALYAAAVSGTAYLVWRRWSFRMTDAERDKYVAGLLLGERGSVIVYLTNAAFYLCTLLALLYFYAR